MTQGGGDTITGEQYYYYQQQQQQQQLGPDQHPLPYYGTFSGNPNFPQPVPPSAGQAPGYQASIPPSTPYQYPPGAAEGRPAQRPFQHWDRLPFCGLGVGWFLFILGFVCISLSWWIGAFIFFCLKHDPRERVGLAACTIAAIIALIAGTKFVTF
ncbi:hypothetical protein O6H91_11G080000 [Diphasiastrum complanatum]|uniref:Uncharacterized protein n=1 Tax=Diphasiastrum complanatum TaxID=34168 RepID=A0ACC2CBD5_DIPCM|nr:hypothetical protein O6H91_11G080000 [Diphasiastrum complanatum]